MATNQFGTQQRTGSLFNPGLFDDPDALAQAALVENPPAQIPSPDAMNAAPITGRVPRSFTEYAADPVNVAKIPEAVPANTPMPSLVARAVKAAIPAPADMPPPVDSSLAGPPESQQLFPDATPAAGAKGAPSLEDAIMSGPPNGGAGLTAATAPQPPAAVQPTAPAGPLSKEDFLTQHPAHLPNAPYVPHGGKLALTGLFAALDNAGAFLDHGTPTVGPGLMHNVQALQEFNQNLPASTASAQQAAYDEYLKNYGSIRQNSLMPITVKGPDGQPMTTYVDPATQKSMLPAQIKAGGTVEAAKVGAQSRMDVKRLELSIQQGQISKMVPGINPANNQPQYELFNKNGQSLGFADHSIIPGLIARTSSTIEYKEDGDGSLHALPKTTVSAPNLPGAGAGARTPPRPTVQPVNAGGPGATPPASSGPSAHPTVTPQGSAPSQPAGAARPVGQPPSVAGSIVPGFLGKAAKETGVAFNPQDNQYYVTTRAEAATNGYQNFTKSTAAQVDADRQLNNRLTDVQTKVQRYEQAINDPKLTEQDQNKMAYLLNSDKFKLGAFGAEIPVDELNTYLKAARFGELSPEGVKAFQAYVNGREAMLGYQRILTGGSRGNEKSLQLLLDAFPTPAMPKNVINEGLGQFKENLRIAAQGLPRMPGVSNQADVESGKGPGAHNLGGPPAGAKIRDYTQLK